MQNKIVSNMTSKEVLAQLKIWSELYLGLDQPNKEISNTMTQYLQSMCDTVLLDINVIAEIKQLAKENLTNEEFAKKVKVIFTTFDQDF